MCYSPMLAAASRTLTSEQSVPSQAFSDRYTHTPSVSNNYHVTVRRYPHIAGIDARNQ